MVIGGPAPDLLERYLAGSCTRTWEELVAAGPQHPQARPLTSELMRRVRENVDMLSARLDEAGFPVIGWVAPTEEELAMLPQLETIIGPLPLALRCFWEEVGSVCLQQRHFYHHTGVVEERWRPLLIADPLWVEGPKLPLAEAQLWLDGGHGGGDPMLLPLAPDRFHKAQLSDGPPDGITAAAYGIDPLLENHHQPVRFVSYLRDALLTWGGFPGLVDKEEWHPFVVGLSADLEPF